jgi:hypothetical protein
MNIMLSIMIIMLHGMIILLSGMNFMSSSMIIMLCGIILLKGQCHKFFASGFFHESVSPQPQSIPLRPYRNFSKIRGDIRSSRFATGVNDTSGKWNKSSIRKF